MFPEMVIVVRLVVGSTLRVVVGVGSFVIGQIVVSAKTVNPCFHI